MAPSSETGIALSQVATREGKTTFRQNLPCIVYCLLASVASLQYGLDSVNINGAQAMRGFLKVFGYPNPKLAIGYGISTSFQQVITSLMTVGLIIGSLAIGPLGSWLGRRYSFLVGCFLAFVGNTILIVSTNKGAVAFGRLCFGTSNGILIGMSTIYISEAAPAHLRGGLVALQQLTTCIGTIIGACCNNATAKKSSRLSYQIPLIVLYGIPVYFVIISFFLPESPRWLVLKGRPEDARRSLQRLRGSQFPPELIDAELLSIRDAAAAEDELAMGKRHLIRAMFSKQERKRSLITIAAGSFHAASGFPFLTGYATYFFEIAGSSNAFIDTIITNSVSTGGAAFGVVINRYFGRRDILLAGFGIQSVLMFVMGAAWAAKPGTKVAAKVVVSMTVIFQTVFSAGCGPISFASASEIPSVHLRAITYGVGFGIGFIGNFLIQFTTPYFINTAQLNVGPKVGFIWGASNLITFIFIYFCLPETQHRSLENLDEMFYAKVPLRKFKGYQCHGIVHDTELDNVQHKDSSTNVREIETVHV